MSSKPSSSEHVGVIGAGSFGTVFSNLLAKNRQVLLYARRQDRAEELERTRVYHYRGQDWKLDDRITVIHDPERLAGACELIFPVVPSQSFRKMLQQFAPYLHPYHKLLHATKGLEVQVSDEQSLQTVEKLRRSQVKTMSELITEETRVVRIGCVAGPNLASEIADGEPAATVVASPFDEVIREGQLALRSKSFRVHGAHDMIGIELAGALKNIMAIAAGMLAGLDLGINTRAMLITRGLAEMVLLGKGMGAKVNAFLGLAGIGDLVATCSSPSSRNFSVGLQLGQGKALPEIVASMPETAEGVKTISIARGIAKAYKISAPITTVLYRIMYEDLQPTKGVELLMEFPYTSDGEFL